MLPALQRNLLFGSQLKHRRWTAQSVLPVAMSDCLLYTRLNKEAGSFDTLIANHKTRRPIPERRHFQAHCRVNHEVHNEIWEGYEVVSWVRILLNPSGTFLDLGYPYRIFKVIKGLGVTNTTCLVATPNISNINTENFFTNKIAYQFICAQKKAPDRNEAHRSLQNWVSLSTEITTSPVWRLEFGDGY